MHGLSPEDEIDYWRERAQRAEAECESLRAVNEEHLALDVLALVAELRAHRSTALSAEEVEGLRVLSFLLNRHHHEPYAYEGEEVERALDALHRLTAGKP